jgi:hypothetical protein
MTSFEIIIGVSVIVLTVSQLFLFQQVKVTQDYVGEIYERLDRQGINQPKR